jgi:hypothetical protein
MSPVCKIALVVLVAAIIAGLGLPYWSSRTETAYLTSGSIPRYQ